MKKIGILALSAILLTACGGGSGGSNEGTQGTTDTETVLDKLQGTWLGECRADAGGSYQSTLTITNLDIADESKEYDNENCDESGLVLHEVYSGELTIGNQITGANGEEATELDILLLSWSLRQGSVNSIPQTGSVYYTSIVFNNDSQLVFADESETTDGETAETRHVTFDTSSFYTKQ